MNFDFQRFKKRLQYLRDITLPKTRMKNDLTLLYEDFEGFEKELQKMLIGRIALTDSEISEFLYAEDDRGEIFHTAEMHTIAKTVKEILRIE